MYGTERMQKHPCRWDHHPVYPSSSSGVVLTVWCGRLQSLGMDNADHYRGLLWTRVVRFDMMRTGNITGLHSSLGYGTVMDSLLVLD